MADGLDQILNAEEEAEIKLQQVMLLVSKAKLVARELQCLSKGTEGPIRAALIAAMIAQAALLEGQILSLVQSEISMATYRLNRQIRPYIQMLKKAQHIARQARKLQRMMLKIMEMVGGNS